MLESRFNLLKIINMYEGTPLGSKDMMRLLSTNGVSMSERTVRYHLQLLEEAGLTGHSGLKNRHITMKGRNILEGTTGSELGIVSNWLYNLACHTRLDLESGQGKVIISVTTVPIAHLQKALKTLHRIKDTRYIIGSRVFVATEGQMVGTRKVPEGFAAIGVLNSATVLGLIIKEGIPAQPVNLGLLETTGGKSVAIRSLVGLQNISQDVLSLHVNTGMTDISAAVDNEKGKVVAMLFEIPAACCDLMRKFSDKHDFLNVIELGLPGTRLMDIVIEQNRAGVLICDGINALAMLRESGIAYDDNIIIMPFKYENMITLDSALNKYSLKDNKNAY